MLRESMEATKKLKQESNEELIKLKAEFTQKEKEFERLKESMASNAANAEKSEILKLTQEI